MHILKIIIAAVLLYLLFSFSLFLGLQVNPLAGSIGVIVTITLVLIAIVLWKKKSDH